LPVKLSYTTTTHILSLHDALPISESRGEGKGFWQGVVHDENARAGEGLTAHAGLFSTADDMARWSTEWLKGARGESEVFPKRLRSEEHTSELQSHLNLVCRLLLEK